MLFVGNNTFATLPSYSVNLVCHLPFKEVEALRVAVDVDPYNVPETDGETASSYTRREQATRPTQIPSLQQKLREDQGPPLPTKVSKFRFAIQTYGCRFVAFIQNSVK